jgi:small subunit ribosomal protein S6
MRRYELMLVLRPDASDEQVQAIIDRATRTVVSAEGQIIKVSPWGRRRLAYTITGYREGSYFLIVFEAPAAAVAELERALNITEEVMRHLVVRTERPAGRERQARGAEEEAEEEAGQPPYDEDEDVPDTEYIDESESEAAPMAADR